MGSSSATEMSIGMIGKVEKRDGNLNCRRAGVMVGIGGNFKNGASETAASENWASETAANECVVSKTAGSENAASETEGDCRTFLWLGDIGRG